MDQGEERSSEDTTRGGHRGKEGGNSRFAAAAGAVILPSLPTDLKPATMHLSPRRSAAAAAAVLRIFSLGSAAVRPRLRLVAFVGLPLLLLAAVGSAVVVRAQGFLFFRPAPPPRPVQEFVVPRQDPPRVSARLMDRANPDNTRVVISLSKQRVYLLVGEEVALDSPISSGKRGHPTPRGTFRISQKEEAHFSNIYGNFVDRSGRIVRAGVSSRIDSAPSGTHFEGAPMRYFCRLTDTGVGMHVGLLPGYPASHGCIRLPENIAPLIYSKVKTGTSVRVED